LPGNPQVVRFERSTAPIDVYRRRLQLRHALITVEAAIALRDKPGAGGSATVNLEGLREDLLVALWLTDVLLGKRRGLTSSSLGDERAEPGCETRHPCPS
jgi:hypothetical protein